MDTSKLNPLSLIREGKANMTNTVNLSLDAHLSGASTTPRDRWTSTGVHRSKVDSILATWGYGPAAWYARQGDHTTFRFMARSNEDGMWRYGHLNEGPPSLYLSERQRYQTETAAEAIFVEAVELLDADIRQKQNSIRVLTDAIRKLYPQYTAE